MRTRLGLRLREFALGPICFPIAKQVGFCFIRVAGRVGLLLDFAGLAGKIAFRAIRDRIVLALMPLFKVLDRVNVVISHFRFLW